MTTFAFMKAMNKEMLRLALPSILANLTVPLVGMVDIALAGHLDTSAAALIGGISVGSLMFDLLYWNFGFLRAGTGGMTAQAYGRQDWRGCADNLKREVGLALLIAIGLILIQWPFQKLVFLFVGCSDEVRSLALDYFRIRIWAAPATLSLMVFRGWFIGMQDTFSSMLTDLVVNGGNIAFSVILTFGVPALGLDGLGFNGIAFGTLVAQYLGLLFSSTRVMVRFGDVFTFGAAPWLMAALSGEQDTAETSGVSIFGGKEVRRFFTVSRDLFVRSVCLIIVYLAFTSISAGFGDTLLASCSIMLKLLLVFSYFTDGFAFAGEALTGKFVGLRQPKAVRSTVSHTFAWSMGIGVLFVGIYVLAGVPMISLLTSDPKVIEASRRFLPWLIFFPLVSCPAFIWDGIYTGATATKPMRDSNLGCVAAFFIVWIFGRLILGPQSFTYSSYSFAHLLFASYYAHLIYRSLYQTLLYRKSILAPLDIPDHET